MKEYLIGFVVGVIIGMFIKKVFEYLEDVLMCKKMFKGKKNK